MPPKKHNQDNATSSSLQVPLAIVPLSQRSPASLNNGDMSSTPTSTPTKKSTVPSAEEFLKSILEDMSGMDDIEIPPPTSSQIMFADSLGVEMREFPASKQGMSILIDVYIKRKDDFKAQYNDMPASGFIKECLKHKQVTFDGETLTRTEGMSLLKANLKGAKLEDLRKLRYDFNVPANILVTLTDTQAQNALERMTKERDSGGLRDVPKRALFEGSPGVKIESPGKRFRN